MEIPIRNVVAGDYQRFTPGERRIADLILERPWRVVDLPIGRLAKDARVGTSVVSRFSQRIGLSDYRALRLQLARELGEEAARAVPAPSSAPLEARDPAAAAALDSISRDIEALRLALAPLDKEAISRAARLMAAAPRVVFAGGGDSSGGAARRSARMLVRQGWRARAETDLRDATWTEDLDRGDALVVISHRGASPELLEALPAVLDRGPHVVVLTNDPQSPLAGAADVVVRTALPGADDDVAYVLDPIYPVQVVAARALVAAAVAARNAALSG